jgi:hypothetical protein
MDSGQPRCGFRNDTIRFAASYQAFAFSKARAYRFGMKSVRIGAPADLPRLARA